jgi:hypothetical protein
MDERRANLRVIPGGRCCEAVCAGVRVVAAPEEAEPFAVDARVFEEDTWLIMSARPQVPPEPEHPIRLMTGLLEAEPAAVGSVVVTDGRPVRMRAVVHDVNAEPICRERWVHDALVAIIAETESRRLSALAMPALGVTHGRLPIERFAALLAGVLYQTPPLLLKRVWLIAPLPRNRQLIEALEPLGIHDQ